MSQYPIHGHGFAVTLRTSHRDVCHKIAALLLVISISLETGFDVPVFFIWSFPPRFRTRLWRVSAAGRSLQLVERGVL